MQGVGVDDVMRDGTVDCFVGVQNLNSPAKRQKSVSDGNVQSIVDACSSKRAQSVDVVLNRSDEIAASTVQLGGESHGVPVNVAGENGLSFSDLWDVQDQAEFKKAVATLSDDELESSAKAFALKQSTVFTEEEWASLPDIDDDSFAQLWSGKKRLVNHRLPKPVCCILQLLVIRLLQRAFCSDCNYSKAMKLLQLLPALTLWTARSSHFGLFARKVILLRLMSFCKSRRCDVLVSDALQHVTYQQLKQRRKVGELEAEKQAAFSGWTIPLWKMIVLHPTFAESINQKLVSLLYSTALDGTISFESMRWMRQAFCQESGPSFDCTHDCALKVSAFGTTELLRKSMFVFARLNVSQSFLCPDFLKSWSDKCMQYFASSSFSPEELSTVIHLLAMLDVCIADMHVSFFAHWSLACMEKLTAFSPKDLSVLVYSLARLELVDATLFCADFFHFLLPECRSRTDDYDAKDLRKVLHAFTVLDFLGLKNDCRDLVKALAARAILFFKGYHAAVKASSWFCFDIAAGAIDEASYEREARAENVVSNLEKSCADALSELSLSSVWIPELMTIVDMYVPQLRTIIQVDGPLHFRRNGQLNAKSRLMTVLLERLEFKVLRVGYRDIQACNNSPEELRHMLRTLLEIQ